MDPILRSMVVKEILSGEPVSMEFITAHRRKGTGGRWISLENWVKVDYSNDSEPAHQPNTGDKIIRKKDPDHIKNGTLHMINPGNKAQHIVPVHIALIQTFNGKKVING